MWSPPSLDLEVIAGGLRPFPEFAPVEPLQLLERGFGSVALETASGLVVLVAREKSRARGHQVAARLLPLIEGRIGLAVPRPLALLQESKTVPHSMLVYKKLPGRPMRQSDVEHGNRDELAKTIAGFLAELHRIPLPEVRPAHLPEPEPLLTEVPDRLGRLLPTLRRLLRSAEYGRLREWLADFRQDDRMGAYLPVLRHGDAWFGNFLVNEAGKIHAVIDWEDSAIGDAAADMEHQLYLGQEFAEMVIEAYREVGGSFDDDAAHRMRRWWEARELTGISWAVRHGNDPELAESVEKLRRNPILAGW